MLILCWVIVLLLLSYYFTQWQKRRDNPNMAPEFRRDGNVSELVLNENWQHHYMVNGEINGRGVTFLVDTGATDVSIPAHLATELSLRGGAPLYSQTANGLVEVRATRIDRLTIGAIELRNVRANLNPGMQQNQILLGMSALKQVEFTQKDGTLTLRQHH